MQTPLDSLAAWLRVALPSARVEVKAFPSGTVWLDAFAGGRQWQLAFWPEGCQTWPEGGYGVDEITDENSFTHYYSHTSRDMFSAVLALLERLRDAGLPVKATAAAA